MTAMKHARWPIEHETTHHTIVNIVLLNIYGATGVPWKA